MRFNFFYKLVLNISRFKGNSARYCYKRTYVFLQSNRYFCKILIKLIFSRQNLEKTQITDFIKVRPVGAELFHEDGQTDGQTDMTNLTVAFRSFANSTKNCVLNFPPWCLYVHLFVLPIELPKFGGLSWW